MTNQMESCIESILDLLEGVYYMARRPRVSEPLLQAREPMVLEWLQKHFLFFGWFFKGVRFAACIEYP